jgi:hypothetical protein
MNAGAAVKYRGRADMAAGAALKYQSRVRMKAVAAQTHGVEPG